MTTIRGRRLRQRSASSHAVREVRKEMRAARVRFDAGRGRRLRAPLANTPVGGPGREAGTEGKLPQRWPQSGSRAEGKHRRACTFSRETPLHRQRVPRHPASGPIPGQTRRHRVLTEPLSICARKIPRSPLVPSQARRRAIINTVSRVPQAKTFLAALAQPALGI